MATRLFPFILLLYCVFVTAVGHAAPRFLARSWQSEDGLPSNIVRAIAQAGDGYLWIGTAEGIVRFDGQRFTGFPTEPAKTNARSSIRTFFELANGEVWVTTSNNSLLRGRATQLEEVRLPESTETPPPILISQVTLGESGDVFVVRGGEVYRVGDDKSVSTAERTPALDKLLQEDAATAPERGRLVQGESGVRLRGSDGVWQFASETGFTFTDFEGQTESISVEPEAPSEARAMLQDREGNIWIGTHSQGLWRLRPARVEVLTTEDGLKERTAILVFEDRSGNLWLAHPSGGVDCLIAGAVQHFEIGGEGLLRPLSALLETRSGEFWAATRDAQVYVRKGEFFSPAFRSGGPDKVLAMLEDEQGRVWFGGRYGLSIWDGSELRRSVDFGTPEVVNAMVSAGSTIWAGTESGQLFRLVGERVEKVAPEDAFARQSISSLLPDADGSLWIGTLGGGLFHFRDGRVLPLAPRMNRVDPRITCVLDDGAGFLWMGTLGGICRAEKSKLLGPPSAAPGATLVLDRSDGLLTRECTRGGQPSGWRGRDGTLYFSTGNGVARVKPERVALNTIPPPVVIEEASAPGHPFLPTVASLQAGPGRSRLEFRFTALTFTAPEKVRFRTRLEGIDETWRHTAGQRTATYEAVPPGRYRFRVIADNGDGVWNETGAMFPVEVIPHFWETRWFQAFVALLAAVLAVAVGALITRARMRGRMLRLEAQTSREKERARIAQDLHDDLGASLTEISLLANLAAEEQPESKQDDTLPDVAARAQAAVAALDEIVWAVNPRHDTLRSLAEYLASFGARFLSRTGITLRRDVPRDLPEVRLEAERRHNVFLVVREALNNVVKHSGASEVRLRVRLENSELEVAIEDNGCGFAKEVDDLSEGLRGMRERMERIGGSCRIESDSQGMRVLLSLPLASRDRRG